MISGKTKIIAHLGYPTESFKAPMIYNPYFEDRGIDAVVVPMGAKPENYSDVLKAVFSLSNIAGALITMPHKMTTVGLLDEVTTTVKIAGACNAVRRRSDGKLIGDMFDGEGFVRGHSFRVGLGQFAAEEIPAAAGECGEQKDEGGFFHAGGGEAYLSSYRAGRNDTSA